MAAVENRGLELPKVDDKAFVIKGFCLKTDFKLPGVAMQVDACTFVSTKLLRATFATAFMPVVST